MLGRENLKRQIEADIMKSHLFVLVIAYYPNVQEKMNADATWGISTNLLQYQVKGINSKDLKKIKINESSYKPNNVIRFNMPFKIEYHFYLIKGALMRRPQYKRKPPSKRS